MDVIQKSLFERARALRDSRTVRVDTYDEFKEALEEKGAGAQGTGRFVLAHWDGTPETERKIKDETKATIRCVPFEADEEGRCMVTGKPSKQRVVFAQAY